MRANILVLIATTAWATTACAATSEGSNSTSITKLITTTPKCALDCFLHEVHSAKCAVAELTDCLCTNIKLQAEMSVCIQRSCKVDDRIASAQVSQKACEGYPKPDRRQTKTVTIILPTIVTVVVVLRFVARLQVASQLWWDDWTAMMALGFLLIQTGCLFAITELGFGFHYWTINPGNGRKISQIFYAMQLLYMFLRFTAKVSICCFYYRVFADQRFRLATIGVIVFLLLHGVIWLLLLTFQCLPIEAVWDRDIEGRCLNVTAVGYAGAACSILEDIVLIVMPIPQLVKLQMKRNRKLLLVFMFSVASFASIASVIRLKYMIEFNHTFDPTWDLADVVLWSTIEVNMVVLCGSLLTLRPLIRKIPALVDTVNNRVQNVYRRKLQGESIRSCLPNEQSSQAESPGSSIPPSPSSAESSPVKDKVTGVGFQRGEGINSDNTDDLDRKDY